MNSATAYFAIGNPGNGCSCTPPQPIQLDFAPQPGYTLRGESVAYSVDMNVGTYDAPSDMLVPAYGYYRLDINGEYTPSITSYGGVTHYSGTYLLHDPDLVGSIEVQAWEVNSPARPATTTTDATTGTTLPGSMRSRRFPLSPSPRS